MFETKFVEKIKSHFLRPTTFCSDNETVWINMADPDRSQI